MSGGTIQTAPVDRGCLVCFAPDWENETDLENRATVFKREVASGRGTTLGVKGGKERQGG